MFRATIREGVYLELLEERHASHVFALVNREREYLRRWLPWVDATQSVDDSAAFIKSSLEQFASGKGFAAGIWRDGKLSGVIGTHKLDLLNRSGEIGYWIAEPAQGKGIVTDACRAIVTHLFDDLDLNRVTIHCAVGNEKSAAIPQRLGFTEESLARGAHLLHGDFLDVRIFVMLRRDWKLAQAGL
jgi:ribosomal-protein-serine acetyltransferase